MPNSPLEAIRETIRQNYLVAENSAVSSLTKEAALDVTARAQIAQHGADLVQAVRATMKPSLMEAFLAEYGLSTKEGLALMCLAEALLRVPDEETIDDLIEDKIIGGNWSEHAGQSISQLVNVSTMGLQVTNAVLQEGVDGAPSTLGKVIKRLGMPVVRLAVKQVMKELGRQFVLGQNIENALRRAEKLEEKGYSYSYDMLGEAAHTAADADKYFQAYVHSIEALKAKAKGDIRSNPGISIKLSALHPRYEFNNIDRVLSELAPRVLMLAEMAAEANIGLNIDAEEADRLDLSLSIIESVLSKKSLRNWAGFGVVVQAYGKRAPYVLDWLYALAKSLDRNIMVRLVKGAYWDAEIKRAQVMGLVDFPVFTQKKHTDISYIRCTKKLFTMTDRIYPQFATHNAHTVAAVLHFAKDTATEKFEFQRLHGMGESLHEVLMKQAKTKCRIYAPVGVHRDLLAYLVRRLLENGANSSFVNQIVDSAIAPAEVASDPFEQTHENRPSPIKLPPQLFGDMRQNSLGWDVTNPQQMQQIETDRRQFKKHKWNAKPLVAFKSSAKRMTLDIVNPVTMDDTVGGVKLADTNDVDLAFQAAEQGFLKWSKISVDARAKCLEQAANDLENKSSEFFAVLCREAGKSLPDAISEVREAVDFLRFYAAEARLHIKKSAQARGVFVCISPWNFPLAIFVGQIAAALVAGNAVIAKPAEQTPLVAYRMVELLLKAGVPHDVLQFLPGDGATIGASLTAHPSLAGVCFTGSTDTAILINRSMAKHCSPSAPLIAETGGLNAMIVDSTALPEQAIRDIIASSFQSAGQRCSALRILYIQEDIKDRFLNMLYGAMDELKVGDPWLVNTDVGPVIDREARDMIQTYCEQMDASGRLLKRVEVPNVGLFATPTLYEVSGIDDLEREIFGPILHVATYAAKDLTKVVESINNRGFGLTMGLHTRIEERIDDVQAIAKVGNLYVNRNQIGAVVGSQPFGGEGLSGTGPKAGGPEYLNVFVRRNIAHKQTPLILPETRQIMCALVDDLKKQPLPEMRKTMGAPFKQAFPLQEKLIDTVLDALIAYAQKEDVMPSPVGESNVLSKYPRGTILCLGTSLDALIAQVIQALYFGNQVIIGDHENFDATGADIVAMMAPEQILKPIRSALAAREGAIVSLVTDIYTPYRYFAERHCCIDTSAAGGDATLISASF